MNRSLATMATETRSASTGVRRYRLSVEQYLAAIQANIIPDSAPSELLGGFLVNKMPKSPPHSLAIIRLGRYFHRTLPEPWFVIEEKAVELGRFWYPEPDLAIVRGPDDLYQQRAPQAADLGFLIEVADSSYSIDRGQKWRQYASARVAIYWIVNIQQRRIEVYSDPAGRGRSASYRQVTNYSEGDSAPSSSTARTSARSAWATSWLALEDRSSRDSAGHRWALRLYQPQGGRPGRVRGQESIQGNPR